MCRLLVAHWRWLWLLGLALSPRCYIRFVSIYVCVCVSSTFRHISLALFLALELLHIFICEHVWAWWAFIYSCCSVQFSWILQHVLAMSFICIIDIFCLLKKLFSGSKAAMHQFLTINSFLSLRVRSCIHTMHPQKLSDTQYIYVDSAINWLNIPPIFANGKNPLHPQCTLHKQHLYIQCCVCFVACSNHIHIIKFGWDFIDFGHQ